MQVIDGFAHQKDAIHNVVKKMARFLIKLTIMTK